jgi:alpha-L-fucosidase
MKTIWRKKWLVLVAAVALFLSIGAVAWAAAGDDDQAVSSTTTAATGELPAGAESLIAGLTEGLGDGTGTPAEKAAAAAKVMKQRGQKWLQRQAALMEKLRGEMSADDQALYDKLVETFKQQREALKEARQNLAETVKQLHGLRDKYLDITTSTTN